MWLYFNQNGRLLEVSEYDGQARAGTTAFKIFAVFENIDIDTEYTQATLKLYKPDSNGGSYPIILMEKEDGVTFDGPNGIHFVHGQSYKCYSFDFSDLQSGGSPVVLLDIPGLWYAVITLRDARRINVVGSSSFNVQDGISSETDETEAFDAILDYFYRNYGGFVPYTGATNDLDLGSHYLNCYGINTKYLNAATADYQFNLDLENSGLTFVFNDYIRNEAAYVNFPTYDPRAGAEYVAYQSWVSSYYLPLAGGTLAGNLEIKKAGTSDNYIKIWNKDNAHSGFLGADTTGLLTMLESGQWRKIATRNYVDNSTKLYKHTVLVSDNGHGDLIKLVIISKSGNGIQSLDDLGDTISGFVSGFYEDEHSLIYPLLECGVHLTAFGFAFIDENHEFFDATWSNAIITNDVVEEI